MALYDQINDAQVRSLRKEDYQGQLNEMLAAWLQAEGAVGDDLMRLWWSCFNIRSTIACGTSSGAIDMQPGQKVEVNIDGIGRLQNKYIG